jgi:hypothetical protein
MIYELPPPKLDIRINDMLSLKKRGWFGGEPNEPSCRKPNGKHDCEEEHDAAFGPIHSFSQELRRSLTLRNDFDYVTSFRINSLHWRSWS